MCIAVAVPSGVKCPSLDVLERCWRNNDDGAGYAYALDGQVHIKKGFMTWQAFADAFTADSKRYDFTKLGVLIHFRISTSHTITPENTHPFPMSNDTGTLQKLESTSDYAIIHNGIISLTSGTASSEKTTSDTLVFVRDYIWNIAQNRGWFKRKANIELIYRLAGSKIAILNRFGEIIHTEGFTEDNGVWYSNDTYKEARVRFSHNYGGNYAHAYPYAYDYDDYDYDYYGANGYRDYRNQNNKTHKNSFNRYNVVPLMKCSPGDTISGDSVEDSCTSWNDIQYAISKEGFLYYIYKEDSTNTTSLEFIGIGTFYDRTNKERQFTPNYWPREEEFLGGEFPKAILCEDADDVPVYDDALIDVETPKKKEEAANHPAVVDDAVNDATIKS